ncbi:MAG TPA: hypothetical protein VD993_11310 [Chitinophagaceae bacterium]|nr:hypothetical protein [Chitinophagaceae bacterium]
MDQKQQPSQTVQYGDIEIRLTRVNRDDIPRTSIANIAAYNSKGAVVWQAERPRSNLDQYWDMKLDASKNVLIANTTLSFQAIINLDNGKLIDFYLVK